MQPLAVGYPVTIIVVCDDFVGGNVHHHPAACSALHAWRLARLHGAWYGCMVPGIHYHLAAGSAITIRTITRPPLPPGTDVLVVVWNGEVECERRWNGRIVEWCSR
jgi:hypothetical protein